MADDSALLEVLEATLRERGEVRVPAVGLSMGGWFASCDGLVIAPFQLKGAALGRIAVFRCADRWVAHRILLRRGNRFVTKGDGIAALDRPLLLQDAIVGEVVAVVRAGKRIALDTARARLGGWLRATLGWLCVVLALARNPWDGRIIGSRAIGRISK